MSTEHARLSRATSLMLVITAVVQSALLLFLHKSLNHDFWPATDPRWLYALYTTFLGCPLFIYLGVLRWDDRHNAPAVGLLAMVLFWLGWHAGWLARPYAGEGGWTETRLIWQLAPVALLLVFIAAFMFRGWREAGDWRRAPDQFLSRSWDNALTLIFLHLYLLVFCLLLTLWAALFSLINIDFFAELFTTPEFIYPVTGLAGGLGLVIIRQRLGFISTVRHMCEALIRALLPLTAFILLLFLAALPFTGLEPLWETGAGTLLLILLAALILFAFNADFGGERSETYPKALDWLARAAIAVLPINLAIAAWGLWLRVDQHGWTLSRYWALFIILALAAFAGSYLFNMARSATRKRPLEYDSIARWNASLAASLMLALVLVNTGILDFRKLSAASQVNRLQSGEIDREDFDASYLRFELGAYGHRALESLRDEFRDDDPAFAQRIEQLLKQKSRWHRMTAEDIPEDDAALRDLFTIDSGTDVPDELLRKLAGKTQTRHNCLADSNRCRLLELEMDDQRWLVLLRESNQWMRHSLIMTRSEEDGEWLEIGNLGMHGECPDHWRDDDSDEKVELITEPALFLRLGQCAYRIDHRLTPRPLRQADCKDDDTKGDEPVAAKPCRQATRQS